MSPVHTPGPWRTGKPREGCLGTPTPHCAIFAADQQVAYATWTTERDANAHLIAAAPDLLASATAVLERIFEVYRPEYVARAAEKEPESLLGRAVALAAAIAKAEGQ